MSKTCCQLPGGGESLTSTQDTNTVAKQKSTACLEEIAEEVEEEKQERRERKCEYGWFIGTEKATELFLIRSV